MSTSRKEPRTPSKSPAKPPQRTPKCSYKGDELGKNKKQSSIMQFFSPKDKESPLQLVASKRKPSKEVPSKKVLFPNPSVITEPIVISDDDSPRCPQSSIDQFHPKTKHVNSPKTIKKDRPEAHATHVIPPEASVVEHSSSLEKFGKLKADVERRTSPTKSFQKQVVARSEMLQPVVSQSEVLPEVVENNVLKQLKPSNKPSPSFLSTKSRKRKSPETPSPPVTSSEKKARSESTLDERTPVPQASKQGRDESSPKTDPCTPSKIKQSVPRTDPCTPSKLKPSDPRTDPSPPSKIKPSVSRTDPSIPSVAGRIPAECDQTSPTRQAEESEENDSSQMFTNSPLRPSPLKKLEPEPQGLRVKPLQDLLSPRYLTDGLESVRKVPSLVGSKTLETGGSKIYKMPTPLSPAKTSSHSGNPGSHNTPSLTPKETTVAVPECSKTQSSNASGTKPGKPGVASVAPMKSTGQSLDLDKVDWSEPMDQEIIHASPVKRPAPTPNESTLKKIKPDGNSKESLPNVPSTLTPSKTPAAIARVPITPSKTPATPSKTPATPSKTPILPSKAPATPSKASTTPSKNSKPGPSSSNPSTPRKSPFWSPKKGSPRKFGSPFKAELPSGNLLLQHCISECKRYAKMALKLNASNKKVADDYLSLDHSEKLLLHHLLMRKWSWIRQCDMNYNKFVPNLGNALDVLCDTGFVESISDNEELEVILGLLKRPELVELCKSHKMDFVGSKGDLIIRLVNFANRQGGLGFTNKTVKTIMIETAIKAVGKCVRVAEQSRGALQQIFEACMSPIYLEGNLYSFQDRMRGMGDLMDNTKYNNRKLIPFTLSNSQLFLSTTQFDEYIASTILKFDLLAAKERKDVARGIELARDAKASLLIFISSPCVQDFLEKMPRYVWRYTAGSNYTSAVDTGVEFFKKKKEFDTAVLALDVLLAQERYRKHCRGNWYAEKALLLDRLKKPPGEIYDVIMIGLREDLTPIGRLELSKKAEILLNRKKNGLDAVQIKEMRQLMRIPRLNHPVKEIRSVEAPNMSSGTRQTFVEISANGDRTYLNVEQAARNAYMDEYPEGMHDEGSLMKNIILAAFWPVIYKPMDEMFVSMYQHSPLDWGTRLFYVNRKKDIEDQIGRLRNGGIEGVMQQITDVIALYSNSHSLVDWSKISHDFLPTIKNVLTCLTLDKFLLLADYLLEAFRERRSGWPDLTLWNTLAGTFKLVEVKSPNDELSFKQVVWLEKFLEMGIPVEECRVNSSNKNKKRKAMAAQANSDASQEVL